LIKVLPERAVQEVFWYGAAEVSGTGRTLPEKPLEGSLLLIIELLDGSVAELFW
jgi:hypothetical protein